MSVSEKQLAANRANAQLCHGPTTPEGRKKSSQNALRHGLTAQITLMTDEDRVIHDAFCAAIVADLAPVGALENFLATSVAHESWRLNRARAQCENIEAIGHFDGTGDLYDSEHPEIHTAVTATCTVRDNAANLHLLSLYAQRIHRAHQKYYEQLKTLQAERKAKEEKDLEQAREFYQLAELKNLPYDPAEDGFVFSSRQIACYTERYYRRIHARQADNTYEKSHGDFRELLKAA